MSIAPHERVSRSREGSEGFEISIPAKQSLRATLILGPALVGWGMGEVFALADLFLRTDDDASVSWLTIWLIAWTCAGAFLWYVQFWMVIGKEVVILRPATLLIRRELGGFDRSKEYDLPRVTNLRAGSISGDSYDWRGAMHFLGIGGGPIAFDYESRTVRLGSGLPDAEAREIVNELRSRYAFPETAA